MKKISAEFVKHSFSSRGSLNEYYNASLEIGLWESERIIFNQYLKKEQRIIDLGCGTGRVSISLWEQGFRNLVGIDLSEDMIEGAEQLNLERGTQVDFRVGDATALELTSNSIDVVIFAFNGIMQIPTLANRRKAFLEINRVLKSGGMFIFTTHDMERDVQHTSYWVEERELWRKGLQDPRLPEFGDLIYKSYDREMFVHVPRRSEVLSCLSESGFELLEDHYRTEICKESREVIEFSDECRFYIAQKN